MARLNNEKERWTTIKILKLSRQVLKGQLRMKEGGKPESYDDVINRAQWD